MAGRSHLTKEQLLDRRSKVSALYLKGWFQADIAKQFGVSRVTITNDLKIVYRMWRQSAVRDFDQLKERELIKIDNLEKTYWDAWNKSCEDFEKERKKYKKAALTEMNKENIVMFGDSRYLSGVQWCIERRCKILGIDSPEKIDHSSKDGSMSPKEITGITFDK